MRITDGNATVANSAIGAWVALVETPRSQGWGPARMGRRQRERRPRVHLPNQPCTITVTNTVPGLGLSTTGGSTGTTSIVVTATAGTIYVKGLVGPTAVTTGKTYAISLTISDVDASTATTNGTWTAYVAPDVAHPGSQAAEPNQAVSLQMSAACPNGGCSYVAEAQIGNDPTWYAVAINGSGVITYGSAPAGNYQIRVTVTDGSGVSDTTTFPMVVKTFNLIVPNQSSARPASGTRTVTLDVAALMDPQAGGYAYAVSNGPGWLTMNANTGLLTGTLVSNSPGDSSIRVTVTSNVSGTSNVFDDFAWNLT